MADFGEALTNTAQRIQDEIDKASQPWPSFSSDQNGVINITTVPTGYVYNPFAEGLKKAQKILQEEYVKAQG